VIASARFRAMQGISRFSTFAEGKLNNGDEAHSITVQWLTTISMPVAKLAFPRQ